MINKLSGWDDTIVALATPSGIGAIGVIRLSGKESIQIANLLYPAKNLLSQKSHTLHVGLLKQDEVILDEVVISIYKAPRSYTGEDVIEISCHGSPYVQQQVIQACILNGARLARPGEFTQRAFLYGKMDLTQAEAVADLIASNTSASHKSALAYMRGGFSQVLKNLREQMIRFSALIELELDFSQEDVTFADRSDLSDLVSKASRVITALLESFKLGNVIKNGVQVAIVGKPNAGKSTLLNTLLNESRAIVSEIAGTTRDTIEEVVNIAGVLFRLADTAGIREHSSGSIESMGIEKSIQKMKDADVVVYLFDVNEMHMHELLTIGGRLQEEGKQYLLVGNKTDLKGEAIIRQKFSALPAVIFISARANQNIDVLEHKLVDMVLEGNVQTEGTIITNTRHYHALQQTNIALNDISQALKDQIPSDLVALDIRKCLQYLGEITGEITTEDQLDYIFSKFCIGK